MRWAKRQNKCRNQIKNVNRITKCGFYETKFPIGQGVKSIEWGVKAQFEIKPSSCNGLHTYFHDTLWRRENGNDYKHFIYGRFTIALAWFDFKLCFDTLLNIFDAIWFDILRTCSDIFSIWFDHSRIWRCQWRLWIKNGADKALKCTGKDKSSHSAFPLLV